MFTPERGVRLRIGGRSDTGQVRDNNEDNIHLWHYEEHIALGIVADGMGGAVAGEEASRIVIETIQDTLLNAEIIEPNAYNSITEPELAGHLKSTIRSANINIINQAIANPELKGMGTTVTLAMVRNNYIVIGHVGDSRAYIVRGTNGQIEQITVDHSFVQALVDAGHITAEEAEDHAMGNVLYRALGQTRDVEVDVYFEQLSTNDRILLCSDGLTLHVKAPEIAEIVLSYEDPDAACAALVETANSRGGRDNVSVVIIKAEQGNFVNDDSQVHALHGDEDSAEYPVPRESANMGASEVPAIHHRDTQETPHTPQDDQHEHDSQQDLSSADGDSTPPYSPGEGRDNFTPDR